MAEVTLPVTVLAVDDQPVFLRTVRALVDATPGFEHVGQALSGAEALELAAALKPDLILLDLRMPGMDGAEAARQLRRVAPDAVVVLISLGELPDAAATPGISTAVPKKALSPRTLRRVWAAHGRSRRQASSRRGP
jgi:two-component system invasion response regulator UvrY